MADLYELTDVDLNTDPDEEIIEIGKTKIGTHYQHISKPTREFPDPEKGRVIVVSASTLDMGPQEVKWLNVDLYNDTEVGDLGFERLYRVLTYRGVPPKIVGNLGENIGIGYTTFYVFVSDCIQP